MVGIPNTLATRQDYLNIFEYVRNTEDEGQKKALCERLTALKGSRYMKVLKADAVPSLPENAPEGAEPQYQPEDFEDALDPASPFARSGLSESEINQIIGALK